MALFTCHFAYIGIAFQYTTLLVGGINRSFFAFMHFLVLIWLILVCVSVLVPNFIVEIHWFLELWDHSFYSLVTSYRNMGYLVIGFLCIIYLCLSIHLKGFFINKFSVCGCLETMFCTCVLKVEDVLKEVGYGEESRWRNLIIMVCFLCQRHLHLRTLQVSLSLLRVMATIKFSFMNHG